MLSYFTIGQPLFEHHLGRPFANKERAQCRRLEIRWSPGLFVPTIGTMSTRQYPSYLPFVSSSSRQYITMGHHGTKETNQSPSQHLPIPCWHTSYTSSFPMQHSVIPCDPILVLLLFVYTPMHLATSIATCFRSVVKPGFTTAQELSLSKMKLRGGKVYAMNANNPAPPRQRRRSSNKAPDMRYVRAGRIFKGKRVARPLEFPDPEGMDNPGMWCYRRSLLQCLLHTPAFCRFMLREHPGCTVQNAVDCVFCALRLLVNVYWNDKRNFSTDIALDVLDQALERRWAQDEDFALVGLRDRNVQSDPHEFLNKLTESLRSTPAENERIDRTFGVKYMLRSICVECDTTIANEDQEVGLGLPLSNRVNDKELTKYLSEHFNESMRHGFRCDSDHCLNLNMPPMEQPEGRRIVQPPQILVIQLRRFEYRDVGNGFEALKVHDRVRYADRLELGEWSEGGARMSYQLNGVVAHRGKSLNVGHYVAAVRRRGRDGFSVINDSIVGQWQGGGFAEMVAPRVEDRDFDPYLLVYTRVT